jgi:hypothetical protein
MSHELVELSDAELESVSAGFFNTTAINIQKLKAVQINKLTATNSGNAVAVGLVAVAATAGVQQQSANFSFQQAIGAAVAV